MNNNSVVVSIYGTPHKAETALRELFRRGFDMTKISIVGREKPANTGVTAIYDTSGHMQFKGDPKPFWGEVWSWLSGSGVFLVPAVGPVLVAGPMVTWIAAALEGSVTTEGLSAIGRRLRSLGIPKCMVAGYERELMLGKLILVAHGTDDTAASARTILRGTSSELLEQHKLTAPLVKRLLIEA
jgi:hypothetical protein